MEPPALSVDRKSRTCKAWRSVPARCVDFLNPYHGGNGIEVCTEQESFDAFHDGQWAVRYRGDGKPPFSWVPSGNVAEIVLL